MSSPTDPYSEFDKVTQAVLFLASELPPGDFKACFAGMIANVVGNMPEDYWREFIKVEPCGRPGCNCHEEVQKNGAELFKLLRKDHQEHCDVSSGPV